MPTLETAQSWLQQSTLLLQARPSTTRITTKYTLPCHPNPLAKSTTHPKPAKPTPPSTTATPAAATAVLTLKTYDPVSGTTLKYSTNKAAEVGRLIQILGRLARPMAGLPELKEEDITKEEAPAVETPSETPAAVAGKNAAGGAVGGKKGKKKGKK